MKIDFEKWHGNGNDFVIINSLQKNIKINRPFIKKIADRNKGIGFDQLILIAPPTNYNQDFLIRFFNGGDGSEAGMCLNGVRCASKYIWKNSFAPRKDIYIQTKTRNLSCNLNKKNMVSILVGRPSYQSNKKIIDMVKKKVGCKSFISNIGNNHLFLNMKSIQQIDLLELSKRLKSVLMNSNFNLSIYSKTKKGFEIRTFENGVGETLSCGSASLCLASKFIHTKESIVVKSFGGELKFRPYNDGILMIGPAEFIYKGNINE